MSTDTIERLPNTVTRCHALIRTLQSAADDGAAEKIAELEAERDEMKLQIAELESENDDLEKRVEELEENDHPDAIDAINVFLDECERVSPLKYDVPQSEFTNRAIVRLHEAAGRNP